MSRTAWSLLCAMAVATLGGCGTGTPPAGDFRQQAVGSAHRGAKAIERAGCGACHDIPGVRAAHGRVAPPLTAFAERAWIGGEIPNTPENLVRWIENPQALIPRTAMPVVGVQEADARDMAAYLFTLH